VSLVSDYIAARKKRKRIAEIGAIQTTLMKYGADGSQDAADTEEPAPEPSPELKPIIPNDDDLLNDTPDTSQAPSLNEEIDNSAGESEQPEEEATIKVQDPAEAASESSEYDERQKALLEKCVKLWLKYPDPLNSILSPTNTAPPENGIAPESPLPPSLITTIIRVPKNPKVLKGGYLLVPNSESTRWVKRFVELRRPYLHIHSATDGDEVALVSLRNSRVDSQPGVLGILHGPDDYDAQRGGTNGNADFRPSHRRTSSGRVISTIWTGTGGNGNGTNGNGGSPGGQQGLQRLSERMQAAVFAIYGTDNTWLFAARSERDKMDWIFRIDQTYLANSESTPGSGVMSPQYGSEY
jgi:kinesin family protein 1